MNGLEFRSMDAFIGGGGSVTKGKLGLLPLKEKLLHYFVDIFSSRSSLLSFSYFPD